MLHGRFEGGHDNGIKLRAGQRANAFHGKVQIHGRLVGAVGGHGIERIRHANDARHQGDLRSRQSIRVAPAIDMLVVQFDARQHFLQLRNGAHDVRAFDGVLLHQAELFGRKRPRLFQHAILDADFSHVVQQRGNAQLVQLFGGEPKFLPDQCGIFRDAPGVTARVWILFVDGRGEHANRADKQFTVLFRRFFQLLDEFLDVAGHLVEILGELADFQRSSRYGPLMKFAAADGAR